MAEKRQICVEDTVHLKSKQWLIGVVDVSNLFAVAFVETH